MKESGYTITKPNGKHVITVNSLETEESASASPSATKSRISSLRWNRLRRGSVMVLCKAASERNRLRHVSVLNC